MQYQNPILRGFHPDPSVCRVGDDFYLAVSSFEYFPGIPIYHSRDLVNWTHIGNSLQRAEEFPLLPVGDSGGVWAPTIRWHEGLFYVTAALEGYGNFIVTAADPAGEWSAPVWLPEVGGIDPSLYFEDGHAYYCTNDRLDDRETISMQEVDVATGRIIGRRHALWSGTGAHFLEAPHVYRIGSWYYLLVAEGGTFATHRATIARSRSLFGPYEGCPHNPILTNMCDTTWQALCTGHGDLFDDGQGNWWMVHLGTRLARRTMTHLGRETFLTPVHWEDGWPRCGREGRARIQEEGPLTAPQQPLAAFEADMRRVSWEPEWIFLRRPDMTRHRRVPGAMLLTPSARTLRDPDPTFAAVRPLDFDCEVRTAFTFRPRCPGEEAGLAVRLDSNFHITCTVTADEGGRAAVLAMQLEDMRHVIAHQPIPDGEVELRMAADREKYVFTCRVGGETFRIGRASTRFVATELAGRCFTGTVIGLYAASPAAEPETMTVSRFGMYPAGVDQTDKECV